MDRVIVNLTKVIAVTLLSAVMAAPRHRVGGHPEPGSAAVHSEHVDSYFAHSTVEGHAYTTLVPVVRHAPALVAVAYRASPVAAAQPLPVAHAPVVYAVAVPDKTGFYAH